MIGRGIPPVHSEADHVEMADAIELLTVARDAMRRPDFATSYAMQDNRITSSSGSIRTTLGRIDVCASRRLDVSRADGAGPSPEVRVHPRAVPFESGHELPRRASARLTRAIAILERIASQNPRRLARARRDMDDALMGLAAWMTVRGFTGTVTLTAAGPDTPASLNHWGGPASPQNAPQIEWAVSLLPRMLALKRSHGSGFEIDVACASIVLPLHPVDVLRNVVRLPEALRP